MSEHDDFTIPGEVDSLDVLPEMIPARSAFAQGEDGKWRPRVAKTATGYAFENVAGLRSTVENTRAERDTATRRVQELEAAAKAFEGLDPAAARAALERLQSGEVTDKSQMAAREQSIREQLAEKHDEELSAVRQENESLRAEIEDRLVRQEGASAIARAGGNPDLLDPLIERHCDVIKNADGRYEGVVLNEKGQPRVTMREGETGNMTIGEWVADILKNDPRYSGAFAQLARGGSGGDRIRGAVRGGDGGGMDLKVSNEDRITAARRSMAGRRG